MFRIGKYARGFQRSFLSAKLTKPTIVTLSVVGIAQINSFTVAKCDSAIVTPAVEKISVHVAESVMKVETAHQTFWESVISKAQSLLQNVKDAARYMERILAYMIFGAPLVGLVPANYLFGQSVPQLEEITWGYLIWAIQKLGPCFIKLAQWASTRPDIFPPSLIAHLEVLQDDVKVEYPMSVVESTLSEAFGEDWKSVLILDPKPIGSGSVAQVFRGILKKAEKSADEIKVAVKMIHPHVEKVIKTDMELFTMLASLTDHFPSLEILALKDTCDQFAQSMNQQLDLRIEASHLAKFGKKFAHENWAVFPKPIDGFVTKHVLVESLMDGTPINYFMKLSDELGSQTVKLKRKLSDLGTRLILKMVFFDNYVHGDLHPGKKICT
jgi:aarF domain-containing kinase